MRALFGDIERLDALVAAAGAIQFAEEWQPAVFDQIMRVNVTGVLACAEAAGEALCRRAGAIVTLASMWSWFGNPVAPAYGASKGAVAALTRALAVAWAGRGIRVNAVAPGWVETRISAGARSDARRKAMIDARIPIGRWARPIGDHHRDRVSAFGRGQLCQRGYHPCRWRLSGNLAVRAPRALEHGLRVFSFHHLTGLHDHDPMGQRAPLSDRG